MSKTLAVSVRLAPELNDKLAAIAVTLDRPKSWVIEQAVRDYVETQHWQTAAIEVGVAAADAGRVIPHDDVEAWVESWGKPGEYPMPACK